MFAEARLQQKVWLSFTAVCVWVINNTVLMVIRLTSFNGRDEFFFLLRRVVSNVSLLAQH